MYELTDEQTRTDTDDLFFDDVSEEAWAWATDPDDLLP